MRPAGAGDSPSMRAIGAWILIAAAALPLFTLAQIVAHARVDEADSWLYAYYGRQILAGWKLYGDYWDNKPPGIFWVNAAGLWLAGGQYGGVIALCVAASTGVMILLYVCARRWFGVTVAAVGSTLAAALLWLPVYRGGTNRPETFIMLFDLAAVWAYTRALASDRGRTWLAAGALAGGSLIFKQTGLAALAAIGVHQVWLALVSPEDCRRLPRRLAALGCGAAIVLAATGAALAATADLGRAWYGIVRFVKQFAAAHPQGTAWPRWFGLREHVRNLALPVILCIAGLVLRAAMWLDERRSGGAGRRAVPPHSPPGLLVLLAGWLGAAAYLVFIGPSPAFHYVPTALVPLLLLAMWALHAALPLPQAGPYQAVLYRWVALLWLGYMLMPPVEQHLAWLGVASHARLEDPNPFNTRAALRFIDENSDPGDSIYVWDYAPRVYWEANRPCPSRFTTIMNVQQIGRFGQEIVDEIARSLSAAPPKVILLSWRYAQDLAAGGSEDPVSYRALGKWMCAHYRPAVDGDPTSMLVRQDFSPQSSLPWLHDAVSRF